MPVSRLPVLLVDVWKSSLPARQESSDERDVSQGQCEISFYLGDTLPVGIDTGVAVRCIAFPHALYWISSCPCHGGLHFAFATIGTTDQ